MNRFIEKNKESMEKMETYIDTNKDNIRRAITSTELFQYIMEINNITDDMDMGYIRYKGIIMGKDPYYPANKVGFIMKETEIEFDIPCLCGHYNGEGHNNGI